MTTELFLFSLSLAGTFLAMILFVVFGQVTVRKLRKNPQTKKELGLEFASGWDILNVAGALSWPAWLSRKLRNTPLSMLYANADVLKKYTTTFDKVLARAFYFLWLSSVAILLTLATLDAFGFFD